MNAVVERIAFTVNRASEYATEKELAKQIGGSRQQWPVIILRELIDNALDAAEAVTMEPHITIEVRDGVVTVQDNGSGIPHSTVTKSLDYNSRTSDKNRYVSPSRGQLGNALKCLYPLPYLCGGGHIEIHSHGVAHIITFRLDTIRDLPVVDARTHGSNVKNGTRVEIHCAELACSLTHEPEREFYKALDLVDQYAAVNSHAAFVLNDELIPPAVKPMIRKWQVSDPTSAWWYTAETFKHLLGGYIQTNPQMTVRALVATFEGLSSSAKQRQVAGSAGLTRATLTDLILGDEISPNASELLMSMQAHTKPVKPVRLGVIGQSRFEHVASLYNMNCRYKKIEVADPHNPMVIELAFCFATESDQGLRELVGVNFSPLPNAQPLYCVGRALSQVNALDYDPVMAIVHVTAPRVQFSDPGKTRLQLPDEIEEQITQAMIVLGKPWLRLTRKRDRENRVLERDIALLYEKPKKVTIIDAAYSVMKTAYLKASGDGQYPANARQIMYAARPAILEITGRQEISSVYFTQTLLPDYMLEHAGECHDWDVLYDDRGHFTEPHTPTSFGIGTLSVRRYLNPERLNDQPVTMLSKYREVTHGPENRFNTVLFIEKEGFMPLFERAQIQERFDLAIMSTKGVSTTAARSLVETLSEQGGVTIFVLHDFDKAGFTISHTLQSNTRRYEFKHTPKVIDLGLRLADCEGLESEPVSYDTNVNPQDGIMDAGATQEEADFLVSGGYEKRWSGRRVELNAMTSTQLVQWLENKLVEHGIEKLIPDEERLQTAFENFLRRRLLNQHIEKARSDIDLLDLSGYQSEDIVEEVETALTKHADWPWDQAVGRLVERLDLDSSDLTTDLGQ